MNQSLHLNLCLVAVTVLSLTMPAMGKASAKCPGWCNNKVNKEKGWKDTIAGQTTPKCEWQACQECPQWKRQCAKCPGWCNNKKNAPKGWLDTIEGQTTPKCYWKKCFECPQWLENCNASTSCGSLHVANSDQEGTLSGSTGDQVLVTCANGFTGGSAQAVCEALGDGTSAHSAWTGAPTCVAASCGTLFVNHSNQRGATIGITGDTALVICNEGDYATAECKGTSTGVSAWSNAPDCQKCTGVECFHESPKKGFWDCNVLWSDANSKEDCAQECLKGGCGGFSVSGDGTCRVMSKTRGQLATECGWRADSSATYYKSKAQGPVGDESKFYPQVFAEKTYCDTHKLQSRQISSRDACRILCASSSQCNYFMYAESSGTTIKWCMTSETCTATLSEGYDPLGFSGRYPDGNPYKIYQLERDTGDDYDGEGDDVSQPRLLQDRVEAPSGMFDKDLYVNAVMV